MVEIVQIGERVTYQLQEGGSYEPHPSGNGIIAFNPGYQPLWVRVENGTYKQDWFEGWTEAKTFTESAWQKLNAQKPSR